MLAPAGSSERGYLSVLVEAYAETEKLFDVAPGAFRPPPKVWSSVMRLTFKPRIIANEDLFWETVSAGFAQKRKTILNNLRSAPEDLRMHLEQAGGGASLLEDAGLDPQRRAEALTLAEWFALTEALARRGR